LEIYILKELFFTTIGNKKIYDSLVLKIGLFEKDSFKFISKENNEPVIAFNIDDDKWEVSMEDLSGIIQSKNISISIPLYDNLHKLRRVYLAENIQKKRLTESYFHYRLYENHVIDTDEKVPYHFFTIITSKPEKNMIDKYYLVNLKYNLKYSYAGDVIYSFTENGTDFIGKKLVFDKDFYQIVEYKTLSIELKYRLNQKLNSGEYFANYIPKIDITTKTLFNYQRNNVEPRLGEENWECFFYSNPIEKELNKFSIYLIEIRMVSKNLYQSNNQYIGNITLSNKNLTFTYYEGTIVPYNSMTTTEFNELKLNEQIIDLLGISSIRVKLLFPTKNIFSGLVPKTEPKPKPEPEPKPKLEPKIIIKPNRQFPLHREGFFFPEIGRREAEILFVKDGKFIFHKILFINEQFINDKRNWIIDYDNKYNDIRYYIGTGYKNDDNKQLYIFSRKENKSFISKEWTSFDINIHIIINREVIQEFKAHMELIDGELQTKNDDVKFEINTFSTSVDLWFVKKILLTENDIDTKDTLPFF
jgi:hypothetical protein